MTEFQATIRVVGFAWLLAMAALLAVGMLGNTIKTRGLVYHKTARGLGELSPGRVQLLLVTLGTGTGYLVQVLRSADSSGPHAPPLGWTALVAASNGIYLAGKAVKALRAQGKKNTPKP